MTFLSLSERFVIVVMRLNKLSKENENKQYKLCCIIQSDILCVHQMAHTLEAHQVHLDRLGHLVNLEEMDTTLDQLMWASTLQNIYRVRENSSFDLFMQKVQCNSV